MRKLLRSKKALSPVVAAIILIAVTVAVSIAVAAWMGALTFTFMKTESLEFPLTVGWQGTSGSPNNNITMSVKNTGSVDLYLSICKVNNVAKTLNVTTPVKVATGATLYLQVRNVGWNSGYTYEIRFVATSGTEFAKSYIAS